MKNVIILDHPLLKHKLTHIRKKTTNTKEFREYMIEISKLTAYEVLKNIKLKEIKIETPVAKGKGFEIEEKVNLFPILRAGLGMVEGYLTLLPNARIGHIGIYRDHQTLEPVKYLFKHPKDTSKKTLNIVLDPMLATGGSAVAALSMMKEAGYTNIVLVGLVASQKAIDKITKEHPDVKLYLAANDGKLNENGYIVPGLGDAGDRLFGTK